MGTYTITLNSKDDVDRVLCALAIAADDYTDRAGRTPHRIEFAALMRESDTMRQLRAGVAVSTLTPHPSTPTTEGVAWLARYAELDAAQVDLAALYDAANESNGEYPDEEQADLNEAWADLARAARPLVAGEADTAETCGARSGGSVCTERPGHAGNHVERGPVMMNRAAWTPDHVETMAAVAAARSAQAGA